MENSLIVRKDEGKIFWDSRGIIDYLKKGKQIPRQYYGSFLINFDKTTR